MLRRAPACQRSRSRLNRIRRPADAHPVRRVRDAERGRFVGSGAGKNVVDAEHRADPCSAAQAAGRAGAQRPSGIGLRTKIRGALALALVLAWVGLARADTFRVLDGNREAIQARIDLIQQAQHEVALAYYAVDKGRVPASLLAVLQQAAQRGVRVRMIVDGLKSRFPVQLYRYLETQGVEVRSYHPLRAAHPLWVNRRIHVKLIVADGRRMIVGSRNLQDEHFGLDEENFVDCDAYVRGDSAAHALRYFDRLWQSEHVQPVRYLDSPTYGVLGLRPLGDDPWTAAWRNAHRPQDFQRLLARSLAVLVQCHGIDLHTQNDWAAEQIEGVPVVVLHDHSPAKHQHQVQESLLKLIDGAQSSVLIETGYPALTRAVCRALLSARERGVQVTLVTNSLSSIDNVAVYAAYQNVKGKLLDAGVALWEYCGPETLHAKTMVVDQCAAMIGSYNFDPRSAYLNLELVILTRDRRAAAALQQVALQHIANSRRVRSGSPTTPLHGSLQKWFPGAFDGVPQDASAARQVKLQLHRLTVPAFRWLL